MDKEIRLFLESGVIEDYCLGAASPEDVEKLMVLCKQFPEAQACLEKSQKTMESFIGEFSNKPSGLSKNIIRNQILDNQKLENAKLIGDDQMLPEFIGISRNSNVKDWDALVEGIEPPATFDNIHLKPLFVSDKEELVLIWAKELVPDEIHIDVDERFLLLEGSADCYIGDEVFSMVKGDFMQIPLNINHRVVVTSSVPGKAILTRVSL